MITLRQFSSVSQRLQEEQTPTAEVQTRRLLVVLLVNVESQSVHSQPQLGSLLVLDVKVVDSIHLQVLGDLQVLHYSVLPARIHSTQLSSFKSILIDSVRSHKNTHSLQHAVVLLVPHLNPLLPLFSGEFVLLLDSEGRQQRSATSQRSTISGFCLKRPYSSFVDVLFPVVDHKVVCTCKSFAKAKIPNPA